MKLEKLFQIPPPSKNSGKLFHIKKLNKKLSRLNPIENYFMKKENMKLNNNPTRTKMSERHTYKTDEDHYLLSQYELKDIKEIIQDMSEQQNEN